MKAGGEKECMFSKKYKEAQVAGSKASLVVESELCIQLAWGLSVPGATYYFASLAKP